MLKQIILFLFISLNTNIHSLNYLFNNFDQLEQASFETQIDKLIEGLQKRKQEQEDQSSEYKKKLDKTQATLSGLRSKLKSLKGQESLFVNKLLGVYDQIVQTLTEIDHVEQQIISSINSHIKLFQDQKLDPEFKNKNIYFPIKSIYSIEDLEKVYNLIVNFEVNIKKSQDRLKKISTDLETRKKSLDLLNQEYEDKKKEQKDLKNLSNNEEKTPNLEFTFQQTGELLDTQENSIKLKIDLIKLRIQESEQKSHQIDSQIKIDQLQLNIVNKEYAKIKDNLRVDQKDVRKSDLFLKNSLQEYSKKQIELNKKIDQLNILKNKELNKIDEYKKKLNISDSDYDSIAKWAYKPKTSEEWDSFISIGSLSNQINYEIDPSKEYILAQIDYEKAIINELEVKNLVTHTWYKIIQHKGLDTPEELSKEIKQYEKIRANIQSSMSLISDRKSNASSVLNENAMISDSVKERFQDFKRLKNTLFKDNPADFNKILIAIKDEFSENSSRRAETITQSIELLNNTALVLDRINNKIDSIIKELNYKVQWGSVPPIWKSLHNFIPDIKAFGNYLFNIKFNQKILDIKETVIDQINYYLTHLFDLLSLLLQVLMWLLVYILLNLFIPDFIKFFTSSNLLIGIGIRKNWGVIISNFIAVIFSFVYRYLAPIFTWFTLFIGIRYNFIDDSILGILFYLLSIPFWVYYAHKFINLFKEANEQYNYLFASKDYQNKFFFLLKFLLYSSIAIFLFREAFLLSPFVKHDLGTVLMAANYILFQITLISLLKKENILSLLPKETDLGKWLYVTIKNYYYVFFIAALLLIILSNPYIGYGAQFFWVVSRIIIILLLIPFFIAVHIQAKRLFTGFFLSNAEESVKERFPHSRTVFGLLVIANFLFLTFLYLIVAANIWGYPIGFQRMFEWLQTTLYTYADTETGQIISVDLLRVGKAIFYIGCGFVLAYFINKYILGHIFDLLLINTGIQNAILNLVKYIVVLFSIIISLKSIGLGSSLLYVFAIIGGLGVAGKEVISDFIAYFIILIQRPLKIGDYVRVDSESEGVVRHITLRSVLIRHKNSTTIIIPNSYVINKSLTNWNYSRTFFAFEDIILAVPYSSDPVLVKNLIFQVLDTNINVLKNPAPIIRLVDFIDNGYQFLVRGFMSPEKVLDQFDIASDIRFQIVKILLEHNIKIASPTRLVVLEKVLGQDTNR